MAIPQPKENGIMGDFFKGWRRQVGVMTLVMACVFAGGWVRSKFKLDSTQTGTVNSTHSLISMNGDIYWLRVNLPNAKTTLWQSSDMRRPLSPWEGFNPISRTEVAGIEFAVGQHKNIATIKMHLWVIPYWSVTVPLTLISAYLLLSKPSPSTKKKTAEPIPEKVA
jgi:hypothetical protein